MKIQLTLKKDSDNSYPDNQELELYADGDLIFLELTGSIRTVAVNGDELLCALLAIKGR